MPLRVDHADRRSQLAEAVWRIVAREGVRGASVRGVAQEAGLSMGSVRYFFGTQDQLLQFAMREVINRAGARIRAGAAARASAVGEGRPADAALSLLEQVLPLDDGRLTEARVWAGFTGHTNDQGMTAIRREADDAIRQLCHTCLTELAGHGLLDPSRDITVETERLWALLDGLTEHILFDPTRTSTACVETVLRTHLTDLQPSQGVGRAEHASVG